MLKKKKMRRENVLRRKYVLKKKSFALKRVVIFGYIVLQYNGESQYTQSSSACKSESLGENVGCPYITATLSKS